MKTKAGCINRNPDPAQKLKNKKKPAGFSRCQVCARGRMGLVRTAWCGRVGADCRPVLGCLRTE